MTIPIERIRLTPTQLQQLQPLTDILDETSEEDMQAGRVPLIAANVWLTGNREGLVEVFIVPYEKAVKIDKIIFQEDKK